METSPLTGSSRSSLGWTLAQAVVYSMGSGRLFRSGAELLLNRARVIELHDQGSDSP